MGGGKIMKMLIDEKMDIENYFKNLYGDEYEAYLEGFQIQDEHIISYDGKIMLVLGNPYIINYEDESIFLQDGLRVCGKGSKRKWREIQDDYGEGKKGEVYIMTYDEMVNTFGREIANKLFDNGVIPNEWYE